MSALNQVPWGVPKISDADCLDIISKKKYYSDVYNLALKNLINGDKKLSIYALDDFLRYSKKDPKDVAVYNFIEKQTASLRRNGTMVDLHGIEVKESIWKTPLKNIEPAPATQINIPNTNRRKSLLTMFGGWLKENPKQDPQAITEPVSRLTSNQESAPALPILKNRLTSSRSMLTRLGLSALAAAALFFSSANDKSSTEKTTDADTAASVDVNGGTDTTNSKTIPPGIDFDKKENKLTIAKENKLTIADATSTVNNNIYKIKAGDGWEKIIKTQSKLLKGYSDKVQANAIYNLLETRAGKALLGNSELGKTVNIDDIDKLLEKLTITRENGARENLLQRAIRLDKESQNK